MSASNVRRFLLGVVVGLLLYLGIDWLERQVVDSWDPHASYG